MNTYPLGSYTPILWTDYGAKYPVWCTLIHTTIWCFYPHFDRNHKAIIRTPA
jgi:hypothetical protein